MWIRQPLYASDLWDVDKEDWEYELVLVKDAETNNNMVKFQQVPPEHLHEEIFSQATEMFGPDKTDKEEETQHKQHEKIAQMKNNQNLARVWTLAVPTLISKES